MDRAKRGRIASSLVCPHCRGELGDASTTCSRCARVYTHEPGHYNFLSEELRRDFAIVDTVNVAAHEYDSMASAIIRQHREGLILDCGAGSHREDYPNVVFYEIAAYPSTDVLGVGERLPFRDGTFDAAFSLNVLEHVADPFLCARELTRVLKPGGLLYCVVPFLQPLHGYPNHFYNMTGQGLRRLFEQDFDIVQHEVPLSGVPIWTLNWFLRSWMNELPEETRDAFGKLRVADLIAQEPTAFLTEDFVRRLSPEANFELASTTMIVARKIVS